MTTTAPADVFTGDRYERLQQAADLLASDENVSAAPFPYDSAGIRAFAVTIADERLLDGLTDRDADRVVMFALLDFTRGAARMAWRLGDLLSDKPTVPFEYDRELAAVCALARIFAVTLGDLLDGGIDLGADELDGQVGR